MSAVGAGVQGGATQQRNQEATVWVGGLDDRLTEGQQGRTAQRAPAPPTAGAASSNKEKAKAAHASIRHDVGYAVEVKSVCVDARRPPSLTVCLLLVDCAVRTELLFELFINAGPVGQ